MNVRTNYRRVLTTAVLAPAIALACAESPSGTVAPTDASFARLAAADQGGRLFTSVLLGANEVTAAGGDLDASGLAKVTINVGQREVCWDVTVSGTSPIILAHIHSAPAGVSGPVVVNFGLRPAAPVTDGRFSGCTTVSRELAKEIAAEPEEYYVNVHSTQFPGGAVRGQLE